MSQLDTTNYIYLIVPIKYKCVYTSLLVKMSEAGISILADCSSCCSGNNRQLINCWIIFQAACAAYDLSETKKADLYINYIIAQLGLQCDKEDIDDDGGGGTVDPPVDPPVTTKENNIYYGNTNIASCYLKYPEVMVAYGKLEDEHAGEQYYTENIRILCHNILTQHFEMVDELVWLTGKCKMDTQMEVLKTQCFTDIKILEKLYCKAR